ncbi:TldD/PmbA family protein [Baekduia sp. Peel2402]|uniref:TldD/PmbA family protein n=1 Tax=Baekduia sp. Peel2402 TaxID=3458296 RepID=UPI00403E9786
MLDLLQATVDAAADHCDYAEARHVHTAEEHLAIHDNLVDAADAAESEGIGVRVLVGGAWGFAATREVSARGAQEALKRALAVAAAQPAAAARPLAPVAPQQGHWEGPCAIDPFALSLEERLSHLFAAVSAMRGDARIVRADASAAMMRTTKALVTSDGTAVTQRLTECGAGIAATAVGGDELQIRTYPCSHGGTVAAAGWEHVLGLNLLDHAPRIAAEAVELLTAPLVPEGRKTIILHAEQLALQLHESIGHALELDRMLLGEASYAGTSWVAATDLMHGLTYGSEHLNVTADATTPGALGTFGWDDEGVPGTRTPLIERGRLVATLSDRQSAAAIGLDRSGGCARAEGFARQPIVRMTNVSVEPGEAGTLEDLLADTEDGALYLESNRSWSIDDRRWQFQFATEVAREIKDGALGKLYRNPSYAGITPEFWGSLDAVCGPSEWALWGLTNCGKGEPGQVMHVSHGTAPARFRDVQVGVAS